MILSLKGNCFNYKIKLNFKLNKIHFKLEIKFFFERKIQNFVLQIKVLTLNKISLVEKLEKNV